MSYPSTPPPTPVTPQPIPVDPPGAQPGPPLATVESPVAIPRRGWRDRLLNRSPDTGGRMAVWLEHVYKKFDEVVGVEDLSFGVPQGGIVGVIGPSGAGKTTSIRLMTGALRPDAGLVRVLGEDPRHFHRRTRERIGYMPQLFVLYPDLTARENVDFMAALFGMPSWRRGKRVNEVLELVDLQEARNRRASALSGGMQRRLELACALVHQPSLLILDEPTAGIDPLLRTRVWQELDRLRKSGVTLIVTTQYVTESEYCDSVALISEGNLVAFAAPDDLRRQALGGDVIEIGTTAPFDVRSLGPVEGVVSIRQTGPTELQVVATDAGAATPRVNDAIEAAGGTVDHSREYRPTFDEVFAVLVTNHAERKRAAEAVVADRHGGAGQAPTGPPADGQAPSDLPQ